MCGLREGYALKNFNSIKLIMANYHYPIKQIVRFQGWIYALKKSQHDQIQNSRLSAIINFNMLDIWQTVPDS